jgi:hypothetical protein
VLAGLCRALKDAPSVARTALQHALAPALRPATALVAPCIRCSSGGGGGGGGGASAAAAAALLRLLMVAVTALPREASAELATDALDAVLALSGENAVSTAGARHRHLLLRSQQWRLLRRDKTHLKVSDASGGMTVSQSGRVRVVTR